MHILFLSDNFPPEVNAAASRVYERACYWVEWGHKVTVLTCAPNFPDGKVFRGYKNKWYQVEDLNGIRVVRVKTFITANKGTLLRVVDFLSYMFMAIAVGIFQKQPDVIVATSPQFFAAVGGWCLGKIKRKSFVFELGDLWPASIRVVMDKPESRALDLIEKLELFLYRQSAAIVALTKSYKQDLITRQISPTKIAVIPNGVNINYFRKLTRDSSLLKSLNLQEKIIIGYIGTHGAAHGLMNVVHTAKLLRDNKVLHFLFVGSGAERNDLIREAEKLSLNNITFIPLQAKDKIMQYWSICDIALVHLKSDELFKTVIPSKIFEAMAMGLPIIYAGPVGEASCIINDDNVGVCIDSNNPDKLKNALLQLTQNNENLKKFSANSLRAAKSHTRENQAQKVLQLLNEVIKGRGDCVADLNAQSLNPIQKDDVS